MPGINYYDGSSFSEVAALEQSDGQTAPAYRWDGSEWVKIYPTSAIPDSDDLHYHYDASDKTDVSTTWATEVGPDLSATGSPSIVSGGLNGLNYVSYSDSDYHEATFASAVSQPDQIFIVFRTPRSNDYILGTTDQNNRHDFKDDGDNWTCRAGSFVSGGSPDDSWHIASLLFNGSNSALRIDGTQVASGNVGGNAYPSISISHLSSYGTVATADVAEILHYPADKSDVQTDAEAYLSDKWGISI